MLMILDINVNNVCISFVCVFMPEFVHKCSTIIGLYSNCILKRRKYSLKYKYSRRYYMLIIFKICCIVLRELCKEKTCKVKLSFMLPEFATITNCSCL